MSLNQPTPHGAPHHGYLPWYAPPQVGAVPPDVPASQYAMPTHPVPQYVPLPPPPPPQYVVPRDVAPQPSPPRVEAQLPPLPSLPPPQRQSAARTPIPVRPSRREAGSKRKRDAERKPRLAKTPPPLPKWPLPKSPSPESASPKLQSTLIAVPVNGVNDAAAVAAEQREELESRQRALIAGFASMIVHLVILITLGLMVAVPKSQQYGGITLQASVEKIDADVLGNAARIDLTKPETVDAGRPVGLSNMTGSPITMPGAVGMASIGVPMAPLTFSGAPVGSGGGDGAGDDMPAGDLPAHTKPGDGNGATFFDIPATGRKIAFVVDSSGSMYDNQRFLRCRSELIESLRSLKPKQFYFVVLFSDRPFPMPGRRLTEATPGNLYRTIAWLNGADPAGTTEPVRALKQALQQRPDAIFLLTDGSFEDGTAEKILKLQTASKKVPIHTIAFEGQDGEEALKQISRATGGIYRYVP